MTMLQEYAAKAQYKSNWWVNRFRKAVLQRAQHLDSAPSPLFIVGTQRSGTNMLEGILDGSLDTWIYNESNPRAFNKYRIKDLETQRQLISSAHSKWVVFKPLCDSQNIDILLDNHPNSKAIWIYRRYQDTANSAVHKWGEIQLNMIRTVVTKPESKRWFCERLSPEIRQIVTNLYHDDMSDHTAAALKWWLRNVIFFELDLLKRGKQVLLVEYEKLVVNPEQVSRVIFDFLDIPFDAKYVEQISSSSINKVPFPDIDPQVAALCDDLLDRLKRAEQMQFDS